MAEVRLSQTAAIIRAVETPVPCRKINTLSGATLGLPHRSRSAKGQCGEGTRFCLHWVREWRRGQHWWSPQLPSLTQKGEHLASTFPQAILPKTPDICTSLFVHQALLTQPKVSRGPDGDMAGSHLVFSQDPQTLPPSDSACLIPTTPFSSAPESLSTFTICQLGGLNTLHTESQPASQAWRSLGPSPCLFFSWAGEWGRGRKPVCSSSPAPSGHLWSLFSQLFLPDHSWNSWGGGQG